jgi:hypothetical protein
MRNSGSVRKLNPESLSTMRMKYCTTFTAVALVVRVTSAQIINFETLPDGSLPTDKMVISNQFLSAFGVSFAFTNGAFPRIAQVGLPRTAFYSSPWGADTPAPGQNCGTFFLTDNRGVNAPPPPLVMTYSVPVGAASGVILDIDGDEAWDIQARNGTNVLSTIHLIASSPNGGNGRAAPWSFTRASNDIAAVWIIYAGPLTNDVGLAFDNFSPSQPIAPPTLTPPSITNGIMSFSVGANFGQTCRVEYATSFPSANWQLLTNVVLTNTPSRAISDSAWTNSPRRFYRAVGIQ